MSGTQHREAAVEVRWSGGRKYDGAAEGRPLKRQKELRWSGERKSIGAAKGSTLERRKKVC